ncbi:double-strand break repair protein AddB [Jiella sp. MQZ9-1]|uniref:Double-strand break repair protein AddB n=1 Tax=Jiella flava TaxID=2816857 RepID=A0A939FXM9_9HYPH|nr:double-strand break repair protein AddB [Jiella flava]MBO0661412.1 double-strand break repair protein AddB [Jiella flava]MCD2470056.1 double-strand break repair protein AddB [Jiella flava]
MSPTVFSIPPGKPFLRTLAEALLSGRLIESFRYDGDPLRLADVTIYLPSRRAARSLSGAFTDALGGQTAILPRIRPIGDGDEAGIFAARTDAPGTALPAMPELERRLCLARLARQWRHLADRVPGETLADDTPERITSASEALWLAGGLGALLDEFETEGTAFETLADLAPEALAAWWQTTLSFLEIITTHWPAFLSARGVSSEAAAKNAWLRDETARLRAGATRGPVILAGSTATAPETIELMQAVAYLPNGALVLPGLDRHIGSHGFSAIDRDRAIAAPGHPQYGLKRILTRFAMAPEAVRHLDEGLSPALAAREAFLASALRPAETTALWAEEAQRFGPNVLDDVALIEASEPRVEALAIAVAMREALEEPGATAALITPDRRLARRVLAELERFGITANDSAGRPLATTAPGTLLASLLQVALEPGDPVALLGLLKHPLCRLGRSAINARNAARAIELIAVRGTVEIADGADLGAIVRRRIAAIEALPAGEAAKLITRPARNVKAAEYPAASQFAEDFSAALRPLTALRKAEPQELPAFAVALTEALETLARDDSGGSKTLYAGENGAALVQFLSDLVAAPETGFAFPARELPDAIAALIAGVSVKPRGGLSARAFVLGTLEARLESVDTAILGSLNEGVWPAGAQSGAFLSRLMRREIALDPPERRIGLAAHDFWMAMGAKRVIMTRSRRVDGAPAIASRWLQRLTTLAGPDVTRTMSARGAAYLVAADALETATDQPRIPRPEPRPPLESRPRRYSVTEVETLIRDPYALHARRILKLEPLPPLMRAPHAAERGSLIHAILADFVIKGIDPNAPNAVEALTLIAREHFDREALPGEIEAVWWPRMVGTIGDFLAWERARDGDIAERLAERGGASEFPSIGVTLTGRSDRIDRLKDGHLVILDFKTGTRPSVRQARALLAPQLALEGGMAMRGDFEGTKPGEIIADLAYVRLRERELKEEGLETAGTKAIQPCDPTELSERAIRRFEGLAARFLKRETAFGSRLRPILAGETSGDYDHLARVKEWSVAGGEDSEGEVE